VGKRRVGQPRVLVLALGSLLLACRGETADPTHQAPPDERPGSTAEAGHVLDLERRSASQAIAWGSVEPSRFKFVEVEVTQVVNPNRRGLTFEVGYRHPGREDVALGMFSLFPPDRPGTFLVATGGELTREGEIVLTLKPVEPLAIEDAVRVSLAPFRLREQ
jgi:hypothetical protein